MKQQKLTLQNQRKDYLTKQGKLKRDLEQLVKQKQELQAERRTDNEPVIKKNVKLQVTRSRTLDAKMSSIVIVRTICNIC